MFDKKLALSPLPVTAAHAAAQASNFGGLVAQNGLAATRDAIVAGIKGVAPDDPPSTNKRLHLLYSQVYTDDELNALAEATLAQLGLGT